MDEVPRDPQIFDEAYYRYGCGPQPYVRASPWLEFYAGIVDAIIRSINPRTVLDAGCALGMVVEAFWDRSVHAEGIDISEFAIANVRADMREYCRVGSLAEPFGKRYDLITCIEVLEHMPPEAAVLAIRNMAEATDTVLFSSSPRDFEEVTHVNVRPPLYWLEQFGEQGLWPDLAHDASYLTQHAVLLRRREAVPDDVLALFNERLRIRYELGARLAEVEAAAQGRERELRGFLATREEETLRVRARADELENSLDDQKREVARLGGRVVEGDEAQQRLLAIQSSTSWRAMSKITRLLSRIPPPLRGQLRRTATAAWWVVTPHRIPARLRYRAERKLALSAETIAAVAAPASMPARTFFTTDDVVEQALPHLAPLPMVSIGRGLRPRIAMITDELGPSSFLGGVGTSALFAAKLADHRRAAISLVTLSEDPGRQIIETLFKAHGLQPSPEVEFRRANLNDPSHPLDVGSEDLFVTTSWRSTRNVLGSVASDRVVYLMQEDERMSYAGGDDRLRVQETISEPGVRVLVNTRLLHDHLLETGCPSLRETGTWFEPAFPESAYVFEPAQRSPLNFLFYARPKHAQHLFLRGLEAIGRASTLGILRQEDWRFHFVGSDLRPMSLPGGGSIEMVQDLTWESYAALMRRMDLGLSLNFTPHPSCPSLDLVASGAVAVTSTSAGKPTLSAYSENIICTEHSVDSLVDGLARGAELARNAELRGSNYEAQNLSRSWDESFARVFRWLDGD